MYNYPYTWGIGVVLKKEDFERGISPMGSLSRGDGRNQQRIMEMLKANPVTAWSQTEIQMALCIKFPSAVNAALHSLQTKGCIEVRIVEGIQYWRFLHDVPNNKDTEVPKFVEGVVNSKKVGESAPDDKKDRVDSIVGEGIKDKSVGSKPHNKQSGKRKDNSKSGESPRGG